MVPWHFLSLKAEVVPKQIGKSFSSYKQCSGTLKTILINFGLMINLTDLGKLLDVSNSCDSSKETLAKKLLVCN